MNLVCKFKTEDVLSSTLGDGENFGCNFGAVTVIADISKMPVYRGAAVITPKAHEGQTLPTQGKVMPEDITVLKVPFFEVSNTSGKTVYIASEVK